MYLTTFIVYERPASTTSGSVPTCCNQVEKEIQPFFRDIENLTQKEFDVATALCRSVIDADYGKDEEGLNLLRLIMRAMSEGNNQVAFLYENKAALLIWREKEKG